MLVLVSFGLLTFEICNSNITINMTLLREAARGIQGARETQEAKIGRLQRFLDKGLYGCHREAIGMVREKLEPATPPQTQRAQ